MPPKIALNRWLTCGCIVSAARKITVRSRWRWWRCPRGRALLMAGFPVISPLQFLRSSLCALVLSISIPASGGLGTVALVVEVVCPPFLLPPPPLSLRPQLSSSSPVSKPWKSRSATSSRPGQRNHNHTPHPHPTTHLITPLLIPLCPGWISTQTHCPPIALYSPHHLR